MSVLCVKVDGGSIIYYNNTRKDFLHWRQGSGHTVEIYDIHCETRREGRGRTMVYALYNMLPKGTRLVWAITRASNFIAQQFYEELNFRVVAVLRAFYQDEHDNTVDAVMYGKSIEVKP